MSEGARRYDIDWLRVIAMLGIFLLHAMHLFDLGTDWHLRNADQSLFILVLRGLIDIWAVPTFFILSGASAWFALRKRTGRRFLLERIRRLLVPLYTVGLFAIVLPQIYFDAFTHGYRGSFGGVIGQSLGSVRFDASWPGLATFFPGHLWFLQFLFLVSVVVIPVLLLLRSEAGQRFVARVAGWCEHRGGIFLLILPIAIVRMALMGFIRGQFTWATFAFFGVLFLIGYMLAADDRFKESIRRNRWVGLALGIASFAVQGFLIMMMRYQMFYERFSPRFIIYEVVLSIGIWGFFVFLMGMSTKHLSKPSRFLTYANEAILPFYLIHQTAILGIGWYVIQWNMGVFAKLMIVAVTSFAGTVLLYDVLVRNSNVMRFFFGMRPRRSE